MVTRTFTVKLSLPKGDGLPLGSTVHVVLPRTDVWSRQPAIQLPTSALRQEGGKTAVWVLDAASMTVRLQTIDIDLEQEPERIRRTFALQTHRVEPAGAIYLWPQGALPQEVR